jgi:hypothetical protein
VPRRRGRIYGGAEQVGRRGASPEAITEAVGDESERVEGGARGVSGGYLGFAGSGEGIDPQFY